MYKIGERVKWMLPLEEDYSYGTIESISKSIATVKGSGYYSGVTTEVHLKYIEKMQRGGGTFGGNRKEYSKRSIT